MPKQQQTVTYTHEEITKMIQDHAAGLAKMPGGSQIKIEVIEGGKDAKIQAVVTFNHAK